MINHGTRAVRGRGGRPDRAAADRAGDGRRPGRGRPAAAPAATIAAPAASAPPAGASRARAARARRRGRACGRTCSPHTAGGASSDSGTSSCGRGRSSGRSRAPPRSRRRSSPAGAWGRPAPAGGVALVGLDDPPAGVGERPGAGERDGVPAQRRGGPRSTMLRPSGVVWMDPPRWPR